MKVRQLINILKEEDPDTEIRLAVDEDCNATYPIMNVTIDENSKKIILIPDEFLHNINLCKKFN